MLTINLYAFKRCNYKIEFSISLLILTNRLCTAVFYFIKRKPKFLDSLLCKFVDVRVTNICTELREHAAGKICTFPCQNEPRD